MKGREAAVDKRQRSLLQFFAPAKAKEDGKSNASEAATQKAASNLNDDELIGRAVDAAGAEPGACNAPLKHPSPPLATDEEPKQTSSMDATDLSAGHLVHPNTAEKEEYLGRSLPDAPDPSPTPAPVQGGPLETQNNAPTNEQLEYELEREARIRRNMEVMRSLGLGAGGAASLPIAPPPQPQRLAVKRRKVGPAPSEPVRRSTRHRGGSDENLRQVAEGEGGIAAKASSPEKHQEAELLHYDDSSVKRYVLEVLQAATAPAPGVCASHHVGRSIRGFHRLPGLLVDAALSRAYSVDWRPGLVVAGGKDGHVSVWGSQALEGGRGAGSGDGGDDTEIEPLLSQKLHKGWISDVQFCSASADVRLLTAGNDGSVACWDVTKSAAQGRKEVTRCLASTKELHAGSGIFSMHEAGGQLLTGSKACSVAMAAVDAGGDIAPVRAWEDLHGGVVKCVRWRWRHDLTISGASGGATVFASCGNDGAVRVVDVREPGTQATVLEGGHSTPVNCVRWSPGNEYVLLSASHDPHILVHDLRCPAQALHALVGHSQQPRLKAIYQPAFVAGGEAIATGGERSDLLSLYRVSDGGTISRGATDLAVGATFCGAERGDPMLCTANRCVAFYVPQWEEP